MPPIDSIGSFSVAALYQRRETQSSKQDSREQTAGFSVQQSLQATQQDQASQNQGVQTQTTRAVAQPTDTRQSEPTGRPAVNDSGTTVQTLSQFLGQFSNVGNERPEPANQPVTTQPETSQTSALNYTASGSANPVQSPTDAGRRVSLSI